MYSPNKHPAVGRSMWFIYYIGQEETSKPFIKTEDYCFWWRGNCKGWKARVPKNTQKATDWAVGVFKQWLEHHKAVAEKKLKFWMMWTRTFVIGYVFLCRKFEKITEKNIHQGVWWKYCLVCNVLSTRNANQTIRLNCVTHLAINSESFIVFWISFFELLPLILINYQSIWS